MLEAHLSTIQPDGAELRVVASVGEAVTVGLDGGNPTESEWMQEDSGLAFLCKVFTGLEPDTKHKVLVRAGSQTKTLSFRTLPRPDGPCRVRFGVLADQHIVPGAREPGPKQGVRRMFGVAEELAFRSLQRMEALGVEFVILAGDTFDPLDQYTLALGRELLGSVRVPCHLMIGNHDVWGSYGEREFHEAFDLPPQGCRSFVHGDTAFLLLSTPDQGSVATSSAQFRWLQEQLETHARTRDTLIFSHYSLLLHPCVQGWRHDGMQLLHSSDAVLALLDRYPRVRAFIAGHKNVPSLTMRNGVFHMLCPQTIQSPCAFSIFEVYEDGLLHNVHEIEEAHWSWVSRDAHGADYSDRHGEEHSRNFFRTFS